MPRPRRRSHPKDPLDATLQELEGRDWGEPDHDSHLVRTCHRLWRTPLRDFTVEDLRIMIGQEIGLPHLVPLALMHLERDPLAQGDYYPGDLLDSVLNVPTAFWRVHPDVVDRVAPVRARARVMMDARDPIHRRLLTALERFATAAD